jgi:hypothetical protein
MVLTNERIRKFHQLVDSCFSDKALENLEMKTVTAAMNVVQKYIDNAASDINVCMRGTGFALVNTFSEYRIPNTALSLQRARL